MVANVVSHLFTQELKTQTQLRQQPRAPRGEMAGGTAKAKKSKAPKEHAALSLASSVPLSSLGGGASSAAPSGPAPPVDAVPAAGSGAVAPASLAPSLDLGGLGGVGALETLAANGGAVFRVARQTIIVLLVGNGNGNGNDGVC